MELVYICKLHMVLCMCESNSYLMDSLVLMTQTSLFNQSLLYGTFKTDISSLEKLSHLSFDSISTSYNDVPILELLQKAFRMFQFWTHVFSILFHFPLNTTKNWNIFFISLNGNEKLKVSILGCFTLTVKVQLGFSYDQYHNKSNLF